MPAIQNIRAMNEPSRVPGRVKRHSGPGRKTRHRRLRRGSMSAAGTRTSRLPNCRTAVAQTTSDRCSTGLASTMPKAIVAMAPTPNSMPATRVCREAPAGGRARLATSTALMTSTMPPIWSGRIVSPSMSHAHSMTKGE